MRELTGVRRLVVFDVDGTLTRTTAVDDRCFARALEERLGAGIDTDWSGYRHATDSGIAAEAFERRLGRAPRDQEMTALRERFLALLASTPEPMREVPGAAALLRDLRRRGGVGIAIATGCWSASALWKLARADVRVEGIAMATADDARSRQEILRTAIHRAGSSDVVTYVGDRPWDLRASRAVGARFVGIACEGEEAPLRAAGAPEVLPDFRDVPRFLAASGLADM